MQLLYPLLFLIILTSYSCQLENESKKPGSNAYNIIPLPAQLHAQEDQFQISSTTTIEYSDLDTASLAVIEKLNKKIEQVTGYPLAINKNSKTNYFLFQKADTISDSEAYHLSVSPARVLIKASHPAGFFYAIQTIYQLLPSAFSATTPKTQKNWYLPAVEIQDVPRFPYRGMHLDVARHFFDIAAVKRYIDRLAFHKINHFHWHLTEDQGWRIEIKQYPKLTEIGAFRNGTLIGHYSDQPHQFDGQRYGGYYTQDEIREVVQYAADRFITIIPEIEMPGHAQAAIASYPELSCTGDSLEVWQLWGVSENVYCPTEATFTFLENVLDEVTALFPGKYIHIGGDECPKKQWKESAFCQQLIRNKKLKDEHGLQSYFIQRIEQYLNGKGKQIIGWDEILEGGLAPNATVMSWRGTKGGIEAANAGHDVIMSPTSHCYFDYYQSDHPDEPLAIGGFLPLQKVYRYEPIPEELSATAAQHILGAQANLWTEYIPDESKLEYMAFPRICALAEVVWSPKEQRNFDYFVKRLVPHIDRLKAMSIQPANHLYDLHADIQSKAGIIELTLHSLAQDAAIYYTVDGSSPSPEAILYKAPIQIGGDVRIKAQAFRGAETAGRIWMQTFDIHKAAGKTIELAHHPHPSYPGNGPASVVNGVLGSDTRYGDAEWLGFSGKDFQATITFDRPISINKLQLRFYKSEGQWIYLPKSIRIFKAGADQKFVEIARYGLVQTDTNVAEVLISLEAVEAQYLKVEAINHGTIAEGRQGAGNPAWLFVDEIRVY